MIVTNKLGEEFELTKQEEKFIKALRRLEKLNQGRLMLFGNGTLSARIGGFSHYREVDSYKLLCEGGDGCDDFD